jgi:hypothetical protein
MMISALLLSALMCVGPVQHAGPHSAGQHHDAQQDRHVCPMHSDVEAPGPGSCPRCGMALVPVDASGSGASLVELETEPAAVIPGRATRLRLTVRDRETGQVVRDFAVVHEKRYHLFVVSRDLEHFDHVHPSQQADGSWVAELTLPRTGSYKVYSDFLPAGGAPQVVAVPLDIAGPAGNPLPLPARLVPDRILKKRVGDMWVTLDQPAPRFVAGREEKLVYRLRDAKTGAPVTGIEPYLGAWGHTVVMSEDTRQFVHAHPVEVVPDGAGAARGGPTLTFATVLPKAGRYRVWTQMKRNGELSTAVFTIAVAPPQ